MTLSAALLLCMAARLPAAEPAEPLKIVELRGDGAELGKQHAQALGPAIKTLHEKYLTKFFGDEQVHAKALMAAFLFRAQMLPEHKAEILSLAQTAGIDPGDAILANCFLDLVPMTTCSSITLPAGAAPDGVARFGRNLDFPALNIADKFSTLLVFHPKDRYAFAAVTWPGLIGVLSAMNEHGLTLASMEVDRNGAAPRAMPYVLLYRMILERCKTVDEAIDLLKKTPRQTANNLMLMDAAGHRAVVEITPAAVAVRPGLDHAALISTNHQRGLDQDKPGRCGRYDYLHDEAKKEYGSIGVSGVEKMLGQVAQGKMTLQSMVFEPSNRVIYLALGEEATKREYQRVELKRYFERMEDGNPNDETRNPNQ